MTEQSKYWKTHEIDVSKGYKKLSVVKPVMYAVLAGAVLATGLCGYFYFRFLNKPVTCTVTAEQKWALENPRQVQKAQADWNSLVKKASDEVEQAYFGPK